MMKKNEVLSCFKDFHRVVQTQYGAVVKVLRSDNGTEYANMTFRHTSQITEYNIKLHAYIYQNKME